MTAQHGVRGDVAVLVPAAGLGIRLGPGQPKALRAFAGVPLLVHAVRRLCAAPSVGCLIVAAPIGLSDHVRQLLAAATDGTDVVVVDGGASRQESVAACLDHVPATYEIVLVHDAARAFAPTSLVERVAEAVRAGRDAVIPVLPVVDTIKRVDAEEAVLVTVDRSPLRVVQTPQGFRRDILVLAHTKAASLGADGGQPATDDASLVERLGVRVWCVPGADAALKITRPADLVLAQALDLAAVTLGP